ncbi:MAG: hypothetical protein NUW37_09245 [Planctomycetes bacterium]|nr:hypothetical protein [Planctomycetota bacterium]
MTIAIAIIWEWLLGSVRKLLLHLKKKGGAESTTNVSSGVGGASVGSMSGGNVIINNHFAPADLDPSLTHFMEKAMLERDRVHNSLATNPAPILSPSSGMRLLVTKIKAMSVSGDRHELRIIWDGGGLLGPDPIGMCISYQGGFSDTGEVDQGVRIDKGAAEFDIEIGYKEVPGS